MGITVWHEPVRGSLIAEVQHEPRVHPELIDEDVNWQQLEQVVATCSRCDELCDSRTQPLFGVGNRAAQLMVIGEAPDAAEDLQSRPFVGEEGRLLSAMLKAIDVDIDSVFITNSLKCRLPKKRDPSTTEKQNCNKHLLQQIQLLQPKAILTLGHVPAQSLLSSKLTIGELRVETHDFEGIPVFATYHPRYLLHKPSEKRKSWQDLLRLKALMATWQ